MWPFVSISFHLTCFQGSFISKHISILHSFLRLNTIPLYGHTLHFVYTFTSWLRFKCFHFLAILTNAALNIHVQVFLWTYVIISLGYTLRTGIAESHGNAVFNVWKNCQTIFTVVPFHIPTSNRWGFQFLHILANTCYFPSFWL